MLAIWAIGYFSGNPNTGTSGAASAKREPSREEVAPNNVELEYSWSKVGFDNVMEADFVVVNNNQFPVKDIEVTCTHFAKSGTRIDSNKRTIFDVIPAQSTKTFAKFNMGFIHTQADSSSCSITDLKL